MVTIGLGPPTCPRKSSRAPVPALPQMGPGERGGVLICNPDGVCKVAKEIQVTVGAGNRDRCVSVLVGRYYMIS
jgi:hypothetical protein